MNCLSIMYKYFIQDSQVVIICLFCLQPYSQMDFTWIILNFNILIWTFEDAIIIGPIVMTQRS